MKKNEKKLKGEKTMIAMFLFMLISSLLLFGFGFYDLLKVNNPRQINLETKFKGVISEIADYKGYTYIKIKGENDYWKIDYSLNHNYESNFIGDFIRKNDSVTKNKCSDTLIIMRNKKRFEFLIGDGLFNNKEKSKEIIEHWRSQRRIITDKNDCND